MLNHQEYKIEQVSLKLLNKNKETLKGNGFGLNEVYGSIKTVSAIRNIDAIVLKGE